MLKVALIGMGYWGTNLARNILASSLFELSYVVDPIIDPESAKLDLPILRDLKDLPVSEIDAVVIATPIQTHFDIAKFFIEREIHVCAAKPLTQNEKDLNFLIELAEEKKAILFCDYTFIYHPVSKVIKDSIDSNSFGKIVSYESIRSNLGKFDLQSSVIDDLFVHDASIIAHLFLENDNIEQIKALATTYFGERDDSSTVSVLIKTEKGKLITINVSWASPRKTRYLAITGTKKMLIWDDTLNENKLTFYDRSAQLDESQTRVGYRLGGACSPFVSNTEALEIMLNDFYTCIENEVNPKINLYKHVAYLKDQVTLQIRGN